MYHYFRDLDFWKLQIDVMQIKSNRKVPQTNRLSLGVLGMYE